MKPDWSDSYDNIYLDSDEELEFEDIPELIELLEKLWNAKLKIDPVPK